MNKAFFLDRDGTINVDHNFVHTPVEWDWCAGAVSAIQWMNENNYKVIVVTNQSGISRGRYSAGDVKKLHCWVNQQLRKQDAFVDEWYFAPYHPVHDKAGKFPAEDRKPGTGMFLKAKEKHDIDFARSYMAGDKISDLNPAVKLGITPFFIRSRHEADQDKEWLAEHKIDQFDTILDIVCTLK